jgi:hypothetical protein
MGLFVLIPFCFYVNGLVYASACREFVSADLHSRRAGSKLDRIHV